MERSAELLLREETAEQDTLNESFRKEESLRTCLKVTVDGGWQGVGGSGRVSQRAQGCWCPPGRPLDL